MYQRFWPLMGFLVYFLTGFGLSAQDIQVDERFQVAREILDVRVLDASDRPIKGLSLDDFALRIGGRPVPLLSCEWVDYQQSGGEFPTYTASAGEADRLKTFEEEDAEFWSEERMMLSEGTEPAPEGRLIVILFQGDLGQDRSSDLQRVSRHIKPMLEELNPNDYVAVYSFHSHLSLHSDFTRDRAMTEEAVYQATRRSDTITFMASEPPTLSTHFEAARGKNVSRMETALLEIGHNLEPFPGVKTLIYVGYGFGRYLAGPYVKLEPEYHDAVFGLNRARVSTFCLDITPTEFHSLSRSMRSLASDTGGTYQSSLNFPETAFRNVVKSIDGYYRISFQMPSSVKSRAKFKLKLLADGRLHVRHPYDGDRF